MPFTDLHRFALLLEFSTTGVKVVTNTTGVSISDKGLLGKDKEDNEVFYPADTVITAIGYVNSDPMITQLREAVTRVHVIADSNRPGKVKEALSSAYWLALDI